MANPFDLGEFIRDQRRNAQISMRQLAKIAGVSNPYLSQIERGLRRPSAEILQQLAKGLRISAEALYVQAGILDERIAGGVVVDAVLADTTINERQKQVLLEVYDSFRKENERGGGATAQNSRDSDDAVAARMAARVRASDDAFADAVDDIELDDDHAEASGASRPTSMRTTMSRHDPRRLP